MVELQAVLLAGGEGDRLYPLTEELPKALLPIANKPLIYYSLKYLENAGFKEVIVVLTKKIAQRVSQYLVEVYKYQGKLKVQLETVNDGTDSADALRLIHNHIKSDFLVMSVDLITDVPILNLVNIHRQHNSTVTMLLKQTSTTTSTPDPMKLTEYIGIANYNPTTSTAAGYNRINKDPHRVAFFSSSADLEDNIDVKRSFLRRWPNVTFSQNLFDGHLYIFSRWVADVLVNKENITSIKHQLVPYLVLNQRFKERKNPDNIIAGIPLSRIESSQKLAYSMSHSTYNSHDLIRCFAYIAPPAKTEPSGIFAKRCLSLVSYLEINRNIAEGEIPVFKFQPAQQQMQKKEQQDSHVIIGSDCAVGVGIEYEKSADNTQTTLKRCNVGNHCKIGKNVKLIDSVIMDHVVIGANCTIKNSVICSNAIIVPRTSLTNCQVGFSYNVSERGDYKNEMFASERLS